MKPTKFTPSKPEDFIGQTALIAKVYFAKFDRFLAGTEQGPASLLFWGEPGTGKSALARALAHHISHPAEVIKQVGSEITCELLRDWRNSLQSPPMWGKFKTIIIEEIDTSRKEIKGKFLDFLNTADLPPYCVIIATTNSGLTDIEAVFADGESNKKRRLQSRFAAEEFKSVGTGVIQSWLTSKWGAVEGVAKGIAESASGDVRQALSDLERMNDYAEVM